MEANTTPVDIKKNIKSNASVKNIVFFMDLQAPAKINDYK